MTGSDDPAELLDRATRDRRQRLDTTSAGFRMVVAALAIGLAVTRLIVGGGSVLWLLVAGAGVWLAVTAARSLAAAPTR